VNVRNVYLKRILTLMIAVLTALSLAGTDPATVSAASGVAAPTKVKATNLYTGVRLTWKKPTKDTTFRVYVKTGGKYKKAGTASANKFVYKKAKSGKTYTFRIRAYRKGSRSGYSRTVTKRFVRSLANMEYKGKGYAVLHGNKPNFSDAQVTRARNAYITFGKLDDRGRCTAVTASVSSETLPREERGDISSVHPTGWVSGQGWQRCHLLAFSLGGGNANPRNLITGSAQLNVSGGMWIFEEQVLNYVRQTGNHVLYRVTPVFKGKEPVARGVHMEARSVENAGLQYNVYVFNVMDGYKIDYSTGRVRAKNAAAEENPGGSSHSNAKRTYILNENTKKFHYPSCSAVKRMKPSNRKKVKTSRKSLIQKGYDPCKICEP